MKLLALLLLIGCTTVNRPPNQSLRQQAADRDIGFYGDTVVLVRFNTPFIYGAIRLQVEECSGLQRNGWPRFYIAGRAPLILEDGTVAGGFYDAKSNSVVFALGHEVETAVVAHELLHFLLSPVRGHPQDLFGSDGKCGQLLQRRS